MLTSSTFAVALSVVLAAEPRAGGELLTVAEKTRYRATSLHADVVAFSEELARRSETVTLTELGVSGEGRSLPLVLVADPPVASKEDVAASGKMLVFLFGNIHAGEVCGKEALLALARELGTTPDHPLLSGLVVAIAPIYNADGNERVARDNRPGQVGPRDGMGIRRNADGLDLNRDYVKLVAPETRVLARFLREWDPALVVDTHTTNGSHHRYDLTYSGPKHPAGDAGIVEYVRDELLPAVDDRMRAERGWETFYYGNFDRAKTSWSTYPAWPRFGANYRGLRNRLTILSEAYAYIPFERRVHVTLDFCRAIIEHAAENRHRIEALVREADADTIARGAAPAPDDLVPIRVQLESFDDPVSVAGWVEVERDGKVVPTDVPRDYDVELRLAFTPRATVPRPHAYLIPPSCGDVVSNLQRHGIAVTELREDVELDVEAHRVLSIQRAEQEYEGRRIVTLDTEVEAGPRRVPAGTLVVSTAQELGTLAVLLLEPESEDGLSAWGFFDDHLSIASEHPVLRLPQPAPLLTTPARVLPEERGRDLPLTLEVLYGDDRIDFDGDVTEVAAWLDDEHFLQVKDGQWLRVHAASGRSAPHLDVERVVESLAALPAIDRTDAEEVVARDDLDWDEDHSAFFFEHDSDLYHVRRDGTRAARLTEGRGEEELAEFSPDGRSVAFVRDHDLWVVDVESMEQRALTTGGSATLRRGKADWVYFEEIFGRKWRTYWWSPDSQRIAFFETDSSEVPSFTIIDDAEEPQEIERATYPKPGQRNPDVRVGIAPVNGGRTAWVDLSRYEEEVLVSRVDWWPDSSRLLICVQDRGQTWLDACAVGRRGGRPRRLFRETTRAWVSRPPDPEFLADGSFLIQLDRTGWRHVYHYSRHGSLRRAVTSGAWEAREIEHVDEEEGFILVRGTHDSPLTEHLYRVSLTGGAPRKLTHEPGTHRVDVAPSGRAFIDRWSTRSRPERVALRSLDGTTLRTIDDNPVHALEEYRLGRVERFRIPTGDGRVLEASLRYPSSFDPSRRYPVWFMTYGGPQSPTLRDRWPRRWGWGPLLAEQGVVVFRCDPWSASGKGAVSAWTAYRQLGVPELADIETAIAWLVRQPWVDAERIGMSGHSYGGFMTAYALTHSELFTAGIAGAPVTDWRDYDTIYTERYMSTPRDNPDGYSSTSVVEDAGNLHGRLLLLHGTMDDNVHLQNTMKLVKALQDADRPFELMLYPGRRHGLRGLHYRRLMLDFVLRTMRPAGAE